MRDVESDKQAAARATDADISRLYADYQDMVFGFICKHYKGRNETREDLASAAWERAIKAMRRGLYRPEAGAFSTWMLTIARNLVNDTYRRESRARFDSLDANPREVADTTLLPIDAMIREESESALYEAIDGLPDRRRTAIALVLSGCSYQFAADAMGIPMGSVKSSIHRGKRDLAEKLAA